MSTVELAAAVTLQLLQAALDWQTKVAAGTITDADIDAKLLELNMGSRQELVDAIAASKVASHG